MHGTNDPQVSFTTLTPERVVPADHPIRAIKPIVDAALRELDPVFDEMYSDVGRPSIPPENLVNLETDVRAFQGEFIATDGRHHRGTFALL